MPDTFELGMVTEHALATAAFARGHNTFIFIRPTTKESCRLIAHGYATKSMDVKDKSSDFGPMAGFVPVNPAFDKNRGLAEGGRTAFTVPDPRLDAHDD